jgi:hypothetical protein
MQTVTDHFGFDVLTAVAMKVFYLLGYHAYLPASFWFLEECHLLGYNAV